jgi:rhamnogalacturonyl hydrolase YesR
VNVESRSDAIAVDTGVLRFEVPRRRFAVVEGLHLHGTPLAISQPVFFLKTATERLTAGPPQAVTITDAGPLRVRLEIRGRYGDSFRYVIRIDAFAGQPFLRVFHSFENMAPQAYTAVQQIALQVPLGLGEEAVYRVGRAAGDTVQGSVGGKTSVVWQKDNDVLSVNSAEEGGHAAGWATVSDAAAGVGMAGRFFWQEYPQGFHLARDAMTYNLWAPESAPARVGRGAAKTHELYLHFHRRTPPTERFLNALTKPLLAHVDPHWTAASGALRNSVAFDGEAVGFLEKFAAAFARHVRRADQEQWDDGGTVRCTTTAVPRRGFYGMFNWGDWNFPGYRDTTKGCDAWGNLEYDLPQVLALAYAATGERRYHEAMVAAARHYMDVDRIHHQAKRPAWVGMNHPKNPLHFTFELGGVDLGHTWTEGLLSVYGLTGDGRALEAAKGIADYLVRRAQAGVRGNPRQWGWPQIALVAVHEATGIPAYAEAAKIYARGGMAAHPPNSSTHWKLGILADGLSYTHELTGDRRILDWLQRFAATASQRRQTLDHRFLAGLAYVGRLTSDEDYLAQAMAAVRQPGFGNWAKPLSIAGRYGFRVLSLAAPSTGVPGAGASPGHDRGPEVTASSDRAAEPSPTQRAASAEVEGVAVETPQTAAPNARAK